MAMEREQYMAMEVEQYMERPLTVYDDYIVVAAIDYGTTYSGYAFSFKATPTDVKAKTNWGTEVGVTRYKTPTCVLTDNNDTFLEFGYEALKTYSDNLDDGPAKYRLYDIFKMQLYNEKILESTTQIMSRCGHVAQAETIVAMSLKYLCGHFVKTIGKTYGRDLSAMEKNQIRWVLTVPAIWSEPAKQFMRNAAFKAGITDSLYSERLVIALEPEAASFWCRQLSLDKFAINTEQGENLNMTNGTKYIVLDCGGGTIDTAVHQVVDDNSIREVYTATGGPWGGTTVDKKFKELLTKLLGEDFINFYTKKNPQDWLSIKIDFQTKKMSYDPISGHSISILITHTFGNEFKSYNTGGAALDIIINEANLEGISFKEGYLILSKNVIEELFMPSIKNIIGHVQDLMRTSKVTDIRYLFLVGGYSDCKLLQKHIRDYFSCHLTVLIPQDAGMSIMRGAALYGHKPESVVSRIARKTYGEATQRPFNPTKHVQFKKKVIDGQEKCTDLFKFWVKKHESVKTGARKTFTMTPYSRETTVHHTYIYSSDKTADEIKYVTDPGVDRIGKLKIDIPDKCLNQSERVIKTHVYLGATELYVCVEDGVRGVHGDSAETNIDFLAE